MSKQEIQIEVTSYLQEKSITKYVVDIKCQNQLWKIYKRYSEFEEMHKQLTEVFYDLPSFPKKQILQLNRSEIESRKENLNEYVNKLIPRREIMNCQYFRDFFILDQYDQFLTPVQIQSKVCNMSIKDIHENQNITLILQYDAGIAAKVDTYMNNILDSSKQAPISSLISYHQSDYKQKLFYREYFKPSLCMHFNNSENAFVVGYKLTLHRSASGIVNYYRLDTEYQIDMEEQFQISQSPIVGVVLIQREIYAITNNYLKICNTRKRETIDEVPIGLHELTTILYNQQRSIIVIANNKGDLYVCQVPFTKIGLTVPTETSLIKSLLIDNDRNYLMTLSYENSCISILDFAKGLQNGYAQIKTKIQVRKKSLCFEWSKKRGELFIGSEDGTISVWNAQDLKPFYIFKAHTKGIIKMIWDEQKSILVTGSEDESIKQWFFPKKWRVGQADNFSTF